MQIPESLFIKDAPAEFIDEMLTAATGVGASDVRITNNAAREKSRIILIEARIDGRLRPFAAAVGKNTGQLMLDLKSKLGIKPSGAFEPVEGTYPIAYAGETHRARVAAFRTHSGSDSIVMRLPQIGPIRQLHELGFSETNYDRVTDMLDGANKMVILAGPMGSGKSSTTWAMLEYLNDGTRSIWSIEDPVERALENEIHFPEEFDEEPVKLPFTVQLEIDEENGAGFDKLLPGLVRADYDTLFLGEVRDKFTAKSGIRQAVVGRQVFTTIHSNDNISALTRLMELAEDTPVSVLDAVRGVISQRLVATLNPDWDGQDPDTKYKGRTPIHEVLTIDEKLIEDFIEGRPLTQIRRESFSSGRATRFLDDAQLLVDAQRTDWVEIARVLGRDTVEAHIGKSLDQIQPDLTPAPAQAPTQVTEPPQTPIQAPTSPPQPAKVPVNSLPDF